MSFMLPESAIHKTHTKYSSNEYNAVIGFDGIIQICNEKFQKMSGYSNQEIIGMPIFNLNIPEEMEQAKKAFQELTDTRKLNITKFTLKKRMIL